MALGLGDPKYDISHLAEAAFQGDIDMLDMLLFTGSRENKFTGDISAHATDMTPLMFAASNGQVEAVELLLKAKADPHMKKHMPYGVDPSDGETATQMADKLGYDEIVKKLKLAEKQMPIRKYMRYGPENNFALKVYESGESSDAKDPFKYIQRDDYTPGVMQAPELAPSSIALLFPGQGSQYVKMLENMKNEPVVQEYCEIAKKICGKDILEICLNGPETALEQTNVCQPAMFLAGMCGLVKLKKENLDAYERPGAVAGLSLGEYTALCCAGVFTFEEGMQLVKVRGEAMQEAAASPPQGMVSIAGLEQDVIEQLCKAQTKGDDVCQIANILFPKGFSCAGTKSAVEKLKETAEAKGAIQAKLLKTGGGFHTSLMKSAQGKLKVELDRLLPSMKPPTCDVYMNVTGTKIKKGTPPSDIVPLLAEQICNVVQWEASVTLMVKDGLEEFYEVGPNKQLKAMMKRINPQVWSSTYNIDV